MKLLYSLARIASLALALAFTAGAHAQTPAGKVGVPWLGHLDHYLDAPAVARLTGGGVGTGGSGAIGTPEEYIKALGNAPVKVQAIKPGDALEF